MEERRTESMGFRTTQSIKAAVEQEARARRMTASDIINFALEERYGLAPEPVEPPQVQAQG